MLSINFMILNFRILKENVRIGLLAGWRKGVGKERCFMKGKCVLLIDFLFFINLIRHPRKHLVANIPRAHAVSNKGEFCAQQGAYGAVCFLGNIQCHMFPCSDWSTTTILENIIDSLGDIERVKLNK